MKQVLNSYSHAGSKNNNEPRLLGSIVNEMLHGNSPLAVGYRQYIASHENATEKEEEKSGWYRNTHLCVDLKTILHTDRSAVAGKNYTGTLVNDDEDHFLFVETLPRPVKRNPRIYVGPFVTITRRDDGTLRPNLRLLNLTQHSNYQQYACHVAHDLIKGFRSLVEKNNNALFPTDTIGW